MSSLPDNQKYDVLLVEDDVITGEAIASSLECFEFKVQHVETGENCLEVIEKSNPSVILLDLNLPDQPGYEVCKKLRMNKNVLAPIIALSGCQDDQEIIRMLEAGADDFIGKKSSVAILIAHMRSALKRIERHAGTAPKIDVLSWGPIQIDRASWKVKIRETDVSMTPTELRLLEVFISSPGAVFTRDQLISRLHGSGYAVTPRTVDVHINALRNHLADLRENLETVRGIGYRFATLQASAQV